MAVVISKENVQRFNNLVWEENLESTEVAIVTEEKRLKMIWKGESIVDISRDFLNTNGVKQHSKVTIEAPVDTDNYFNKFNFNALNQNSKFKKFLVN